MCLPLESARLPTLPLFVSCCGVVGSAHTTLLPSPTVHNEGNMSSTTAFTAQAARLQRSISRIDAQMAQKMFPREQLLQWPDGYLPASGIAHLLRPEGISFGELLECHQDMKQDRQHELQRDFASDYTLWSRCTFDSFVRVLGAHRRRLLMRYTARDRLPRDADLRALFQLAPYLPPRPLSVPPPDTCSTAPPSAVSQYYEFRSYASTQEYAMLPIRGISAPTQLVKFQTFPQVRNVLHTDFDSMTALRAISIYTGDELVLTRELVLHLALYLRRRLSELSQKEDTFVKSGASSSSSMTPTFSRETPVVIFFGNGRLAWMLNECGLLGSTKVRAVQLPRQAEQRRRGHQYLREKVEQESKDGEWRSIHQSFSAVFPCESISVGDALRKYRPAIAIVEPHVDRDYLSDLRGFYSTREVLALGPIDSPAMGSFSFPFLSFGVTPGPTTYWAYNEHLQKVHASERIQMPMDPPHESQGYQRSYVDEISSYLLSPNDCPAINQQLRCLSFRRLQCPVMKSVKHGT